MHFQPRIKFPNQTCCTLYRDTPSSAPLGLTLKYWNELKRAIKYKRSSLFCLDHNDEEKGLRSIDCWWLYQSVIKSLGDMLMRMTQQWRYNIQKNITLQNDEHYFPHCAQQKDNQNKDTQQNKYPLMTLS
jgi:hypothetical protein